jgi:hypothetical protein
LVSYGLAAIGPILAAIHALGPATGRAPAANAWLVAAPLALRDLVLFALLGWGAGQLLRLAAAGIDLVADRAEADRRMAELIERRVVPALERLAEAREPSPAPPADDGRARAMAEVRQAIEEGRWDRAERLARDVARDFPGAAGADRLAEEVAAGREAAVAALHARLDAAQEANDPDAVIGLRDELGRLLGEGPRADLDRRVVAWLMGLIQKRMWTGTVRTDVAELAAKVADHFGHTREGASLRASLPTLRRSAGLCARCGRPYTGIDDACPACLAGAGPAPAPREWGESPEGIREGPRPTNLTRGRRRIGLSKSPSATIRPGNRKDRTMAVSRRLLLAWMLLTPLAWPASGQALYPGNVLPSRTALARLGLERAWYTAVPLGGGTEPIIQISLADTLVFAQTRDAQLHAYDAESGRLLWSTSLGRPTGQAQPVSVNSTGVFAVNGPHLLGMERATGRVLWDQFLPSPSSGPTAATEDQVMVGLSNGQLIAYFVTPRAQQFARQQGPPGGFAWAWQTTGPVTSRPLPANQVVAFAAGAARSTSPGSTPRRWSTARRPTGRSPPRSAPSARGPSWPPRSITTSTASTCSPATNSGSMPPAPRWTSSPSSPATTPTSSIPAATSAPWTPRPASPAGGDGPPHRGRHDAGRQPAAHLHAVAPTAT